MTRYGTERSPMALVQRGLPALEHVRLPVAPHGPRVLHPRAELRLRELAVLLLEADAVGVARLEVRDQHLARDLVLAAGGDVEVDLQERVRVAVEDGRHPLLLEQLDVLEPVDVLARRGGLEVDLLECRDVLLVREALAGQVLGVDREDLLGLAGAGPDIGEPGLLLHGLALVEVLADVRHRLHALALRALAHRRSSVPAGAGTTGSSSTGFSR